MFGTAEPVLPTAISALAVALIILNVLGTVHTFLVLSYLKSTGATGQLSLFSVHLSKNSSLSPSLTNSPPLASASSSSLFGIGLPLRSYPQPWITRGPLRAIGLMSSGKPPPAAFTLGMFCPSLRSPLNNIVPS